MKISRLYLRILFAFIAVQVVAVLAIGALVHLGKIRPPFTRLAEERITIARHILAKELEGTTKITPAIQPKLNETLNVFANAYHAYAWLTDEQGTIVGKSFDGPIPFTGEEELEHSVATDDGDMVYLIEYQDRNDDSDRKAIYVVGAIPYNESGLSIHLLKQWHKRNEELWLMKGLMLMGALSALLLIPISRHIYRPLNELTKSAEHIAQGDFSPRVVTRRKDEVGQLARTFNNMAKSLEKMVRGGRELTANLSHEIRSPLARIRISQQIMLDRLESDRTDGMEKHLKKVEAEINHMDGLIDKILRLSKLDLQEPQPFEDTVDLSDLLKETIDLHQPLMSAKSITMDVNAPSLPPYKCRKEDLRMVLGNVLGNSVKYSTDGTTIALSCEQNDDAITIKISNPYRPLVDEELESIFMPFKRLGYDSVEGNGLGLAFARKVVEEHGGTMTPSSENKQFTMTIRLPLA
jgi:two-component system sensor histidine kinase CpxA